MPENIRALIVILVLAVPILALAKQITLTVVADHEFAVLRNCWFAITLAEFLSPSSFLVFAAAVIILCFYARTVPSIVAALFFVMLFAVPIVDAEIGGFGVINTLLDANDGRLLSVALLLPALILQRNPTRSSQGRFVAPDLFLLLFVLLMTGLQFRAAEFTHVLRVATESTLDIFIPYFFFSRAVTSVEDMRKALAGFVVAALPLAMIGTFESLKGWRLYSAAAEQIGGYAMAYLTREGTLRGSATALSPIILGYILMVAIGCLLALWTRIRVRQYAIAAMAVLVIALIATLSRGPWIGAAIMLVIFLATGPNAIKRLSALAAAGCVAFLLAVLLPGGEHVLEFIPFIGSVETSTIDYRQRLFENALIVIDRNFWLGSIDYMQAPEMEDLMQGQGMIDIVNHYVRIALDAGVIGLGLFALFFGMILLGLRRTLKSAMDADKKATVRAMMATLVGILVTLGTASSIDFVPYVYWSFSGLCVAAVRVATHERAASVNMPQAQRVAG